MEIFNAIKGKLVVSCQAEGESPFNTPEGVLQFAQTAIMGGASAIRSQGLEKTKAIIDGVSIPVVGLIKGEFEDGFVKITGSFEEVEQLVKIGTDIIAIDGTFRLREGMTGPEFIKEVKQRFNCIVMADIATEEEAKACHEAGADCVSTTLAGYTPNTVQNKTEGPNYGLLQNVIDQLPKGYPVFAEGRFNTPQDAAKAIEMGAWGVVVGTAITRPHVVTEWFVQKINAIEVR